MQKGNAIFDDTVMDNHEKLMEMFCSGDLEGLPEVVVNSLVVFRNIIDTDFDSEKAELLQLKNQ